MGAKLVLSFDSFWTGHFCIALFMLIIQTAFHPGNTQQVPLSCHENNLLTRKGIQFLWDCRNSFVKYLWFNSCKLHVVHSLQKNGCLGPLFKVPAACSIDVHTHSDSFMGLRKMYELRLLICVVTSRVNKKDVLWIHRRIHPSFFCSLSGFGSWGQPSEQRSPDFPQPNHLFQLIRGH